MSFAPHLRLLPLALTLTAGAQSALPANPVTSQQVAPLSGTAPVRDAATRAHRAEVLYADGLMTVNAQNSSLNSILREISRQTGMKITGGVREERVFGHYGPALPSTILTTLLNGTGTNIFLRESATAAPLELVLTPRTGGPTPPNPNAPGFDDDREADDDNAARRSPQPQPVQAPPPVVPNGVQPANNPLGDPRNGTPTASQFPTTNSVPTDTLPTPGTAAQPMQGIVDTPNQTVTVPSSTSTDTTTTGTGGAKTPEQYAEELRKLMQQQQKTTAPH